MLQRSVVDRRPLRHRAFRTLWLGSLVGSVGNQVGVFAVGLQAFWLTGSSLAVGAVGAFVAVPMFATSFVAGSLADRLDRRRLGMAATAAQTLVSGGLLAQSMLGNDRLAVIYGLVAVQSVVGSFAAPVRQTYLRMLLPADQMPGAVALYLFAGNAGLMLGPALGGLAAEAGLAVCFALQLTTGVVSFVSVAALPRAPAPDRAVDPTAAQRLPRDVRALVRARPTIGRVLLLDASMTLLGAPVALLPALNADRFGGAPATLGALTASIAVGGTVGTVFSGALSRVVAQGRWLVGAAVTWGAATAALALAGSPAWACVLLATGGVADAVAVTLGQTLVQNSTPDALRGRVSALENVVQMGGPQIGNLRAGVVASWCGAAPALAIGGLCAVAAVTVVAGLSPGLRQVGRSES